MPTEDQIKSRKELDDFLGRVAKPLKSIGRHIKSEWFGRPDSELQGWIERGRAIAEIEDSLGYRLIMEQTHKEIAWARAHLEIGDMNDMELRMYLRSLRFLEDFILTTKRNADIASSVLAGRPQAIAREADVFVKNARVEGDKA